MFEHTPLSSPEEDIRLVKIIPGPSNSLIEISLTLHNLGTPDGGTSPDDSQDTEDAHAGFEDQIIVIDGDDRDSDDEPVTAHGSDLIYTALSYTWGPPQPCKAILINGEDFVVRSNLWDCLHALRDGKANEQYLWIDQICIDQENAVERAQQVQRMDQVYSYADFVLTWLGDHSYVDRILQVAGRCVSRVFANSLNEMTSLNDIERMKLPQNQLLSTVLQDSAHPLEYVLDLARMEPHELPIYKTTFQASFQAELSDSSISQDTFEDLLQDLRGNLYWRRAWILQETLLAHDLRIIGPTCELPWPVFALFHETWRSLDADPASRNDWRSPDSYDGLFRILDTRSLSRGPTMPNSIPFAALMNNMASAECADARDRFYALLGLVVQEVPFEVDYTITTRALYFRTLDWLEPAQPELGVLYVLSVARLLGLDEVEIRAGLSSAEREILGKHEASVSKWVQQLDGDESE